MIRVTQTIVGAGKGNCFAACIASILELSIDDVPNFCVDYPEGVWWERCQEWLSKRDLFLLEFPMDEAGSATLLAGNRWEPAPFGLYIVSGPNPDGVPHSCVWHEGDIWDPNPSRRGIARIHTIGVFCTLRPEASGVRTGGAL